MSAKLTIGFLGAGKMATALARGFIRAKIVTADQVLASDSVPAARAAFAKETKAKVVASNVAVVQAATVVFLAV
ncbi:MAG: NAD(P)-binding domain-containing protein, partial [Verrucomicrobia bacterium]|nr:NAD(P)-binding domain-containing protein [Verrucomicrobiota bacterium]